MRNRVNEQCRTNTGPAHELRAGDGIRTHDILLGKQTLCQLSYTRILLW